jgi:large subunit ribosomal protein L21
MVAVIEDRGSQYRVEAGEAVLVDRMQLEPGATLDLPVLFLSEAGTVSVGTPYVAGATARCEVLAHERGEKGIAGTFRRRKDSRRRVGFRHDFTRLKIVSIKA